MRWLLLLLVVTVHAQTISEKRASLEERERGMSRHAYEELSCVNEELKRAKEELHALYEKGEHLYEKEAHTSAFRSLLDEVRELKKEIGWIEEAWREAAQEEGKDGSYALWHQPWTSMEQLIIDYGSSDYVYIIPPEVGGMRLSVASNLPVPRESWDEVLTGILTNNGVGVREINPFVRQLYLIREQPAHATYITADRHDLLGLPADARVCFVFEEAAASREVLERFIQPATTSVRQVGKTLFLFSSAAGALEVIRLFDFVERAEHSDPDEMILYTYTCQHSDPTELSEALGQVYSLIAPDPKGNFVVYPKTGAIVMVVEQELLPKLHQVLEKIDIPKKMVRIDVLFFEKKLTNKSRVGLDLFKLGSAASKATRAGLGFEKGILNFFLDTPRRGGVPAYDIAYQFLLSQDDVTINANPTVTTMNQTPATIDLVEEISIDTGVVLDTKAKNDRLRRSFKRAEYGIKLELTPTIQTGEADMIHLKTNVLFDTIGAVKQDDHRPDVMRRRITNEVRVADGETIILGGLRRKDMSDSSTRLPFLGELPYVGKLFGSTEMHDRENEMFIFITPHIISDPAEEMRRVQQEELTKRPGDTPEFLRTLDEAKKQLCRRSLEAILGRR